MPRKKKVQEFTLRKILLMYIVDPGKGRWLKFAFTFVDDEFRPDEDENGNIVWRLQDLRGEWESLFGPGYVYELPVCETEGCLRFDLSAIDEIAVADNEFVDEWALKSEVATKSVTLRKKKKAYLNNLTVGMDKALKPIASALLGMNHGDRFMAIHAIIHRLSEMVEEMERGIYAESIDETLEQIEGAIKQGSGEGDASE